MVYQFGFEPTILLSVELAVVAGGEYLLRKTLVMLIQRAKLRSRSAAKSSLKLSSAESSSSLSRILMILSFLC